MFTGIIQAIAVIASIEKKSGLWRFGMYFDETLQENLNHGASVAHNGVCLTVSAVDNECVYFDVMDETLQVTNLNHYEVGDKLNSRSAVSTIRLRASDFLARVLLMQEVYRPVCI